MAIFGCISASTSRVVAIHFSDGTDRASLNGKWFKQIPRAGQKWVMLNSDLSRYYSASRNYVTVPTYRRAALAIRYRPLGAFVVWEANTSVAWFMVHMLPATDVNLCDNSSGAKVSSGQSP